MLKYISYFYQGLALLSIVGGFIMMANSTTPILFIIAGIVGALIFMSIAIVITELAEMKTHIELQTKFMQRISKKRNA